MIVKSSTHSPHLELLNYTGSVPRPGATIAATVRVHSKIPDNIYFGLSVDDQDLGTNVQQGQRDGEFTLFAFAPRCDALRGRLAVQFKQGCFAKTILCGTITYGSSDASLPPPAVFAVSVTGKKKSLTRHRRINSRRPTPASSRRQPSSMPRHNTRPLPSQSANIFEDVSLAVMRISTAEKDPQLVHLGEPHLEIITPTYSMTVNWTREEFEAKRRLVRFVRTVQGSKIQLHCEAITQERYDEQKGLDQWLDNEITISCIWREDTRSYCFTSVNVIDLLEMLLTRDAREEFPASEKGSIRRNLDNLGPTTVSKDRHGLERVFKTIMMFPEPKPFTIEKTVKVFDWMVLEKALKRAVAKYGVFSTTGDGTVLAESPVPTEMPSLDFGESPYFASSPSTVGSDDSPSPSPSLETPVIISTFAPPSMAAPPSAPRTDVWMPAQSPMASNDYAGYSSNGFFFDYGTQSSDSCSSSHQADMPPAEWQPECPYDDPYTTAGDFNGCAAPSFYSL